MPVQVNVCRDREAWGPSSNWFAEILSMGLVVATTDYAPSRNAAIQAAQKLAASRGMEIR